MALTTSSNNSPIRGAGNQNGYFNNNTIPAAANTAPGVIPVTLTKRRIGPRITNVQAHIVASKQLFLQLQSLWNQEPPVDNLVIPQNH